MTIATTEIRELTSLEELFAVMPLMLEGFESMNKKKKVFDLTSEGFVKTLVGVINTTPENGILVAYDGIEPIGYGVAFNDTPTYGSGKHLLLWSLYVRPAFSKKTSVQLFEAAEHLARRQGYTKLEAFNARFSGASFRLFEKIFGMRRSKIQFTKDL